MLLLLSYSEVNYWKLAVDGQLREVNILYVTLAKRGPQEQEQSRMSLSLFEPPDFIFIS